MARRAHSVGTQPLPRLAVRHGLIRAKLAEVALGALDVWFRQTGGVASIASGAKEAVCAIGVTGDRVVRPVIAVVSLEWMHE